MKPLSDRRAVFTRATEADAEELAADMRPADAEECARMNGLAPLAAIRLSIDISDVAFAARVDGRLHCLFGALRDSLLDADAVAWMLCTNEPAKRPRDFLRNCREGFRLLREALPDVQTWANWVSTDNDSAVRWLEWAGAWFDPSARMPAPFGGVFKRFGLNTKSAERITSKCAR